MNLPSAKEVDRASQQKYLDADDAQYLEQFAALLRLLDGEGTPVTDELCDELDCCGDVAKIQDALITHARVLEKLCRVIEKATVERCTEVCDELEDYLWNYGSPDARVAVQDVSARISALPAMVGK